MHAGEENHAQPGWTTSRREQDSPWKSQSEWQKTEINGESIFIVWPTFVPRTAEQQNRFTQFHASEICMPSDLTFAEHQRRDVSELKRVYYPFARPLSFTWRLYTKGLFGGKTRGPSSC